MISAPRACDPNVRWSRHARSGSGAFAFLLMRLQLNSSVSWPPCFLRHHVIQSTHSRSACDRGRVGRSLVSSRTHLDWTPGDAPKRRTAVSASDCGSGRLPELGHHRRDLRDAICAHPWLGGASTVLARQALHAPCCQLGSNRWRGLPAYSHSARANRRARVRSTTSRHSQSLSGFSPSNPGWRGIWLARRALVDRALAFRRRPEPSRQRLRQPVQCSVADPRDIAVGTDQHRDGRSDFAEHRKLPGASVCRVDVLNAA